MDILQKVSNPIGTKFKYERSSRRGLHFTRFKSHRDKVQIYLKRSIGYASMMCFKSHRDKVQIIEEPKKFFLGHASFKSHRDKVQISRFVGSGGNEWRVSNPIGTKFK